MKEPDLLSLEGQIKPFIIKAGEIIAQNWHKKKTITRVNRRDITTSLDVQIEEMLRKELHGLLSSAGFIVEEGQNDNKHEYNWVIDPIDGTKNYIADVPLFNCQVALLKNNEPILGVIYNPISEYYISAVKGHGAYLNGNITKAPVKDTLKDAMLDFDIGLPTKGKLGLIQKLIKDVFRIYITGGQYCPYIMSGAIDAYISINEKIKPGDFFPRLIILKEAGLKVSFLTKNNLKIIVAARSKLYDEIVTILNLTSSV